MAKQVKYPNCMEQVAVFNLAKHLILSRFDQLDDSIIKEGSKKPITWFDTHPEESSYPTPNDWTDRIRQQPLPTSNVNVRTTRSSKSPITHINYDDNSQFNPLHPSMYINSNVLMHALLLFGRAGLMYVCTEYDNN